ncbi:MAG: hypothetical protein OHK0022_61470 [Roseiflexaceae bacterium]
MFTRSVITHSLVGILLATTLAACGQTGTGNQPTAQPTNPATAQPTIPATTQPATPAQPTAQPTGQPTAQPTAQPAKPTAPVQPTAQPAKPIIGFEPKSGGPGTKVRVFGSGYKPGAPVVVRLGLPQPMGEVLASAVPGDNGRWSLELTMPDALPSGDPVPGGQLFLVAMNDQNIALASAPFAFARADGPPPGGPTLEGASQTVRDLLNAFSSGKVEPYLAANLRREIAAGRPAHQVLGIAPMAWQSFSVGAPLDRPSEVLFVPATLVYPTYREQRLFMLVVEDGRWRITESALENPAPSGEAITTVVSFLEAVKADRTMKRALPYLGGRLRAAVERGEVSDAGAVLQEQNPFVSFNVGKIQGSDQQNTYVEVTLFYGSDTTTGAPRIVTVSDQEGGGWRVLKVSIPPGREGNNAGNRPGPGWTALWNEQRGTFKEEVFFLASSLRPQTDFVDEFLRQNRRVAAEVLVMHSADKQSRVALAVDGRSIRAADRELLAWPATDRPAAFLLALDPGSSVYINILPLRADGSAYGRVIGVNWNQGEAAFRLAPQP